jgi:aldehyde dehydrogenase (NAD+)
VITFEDGNFDLAVDVSIASAFKLSGQRCVSSGRMLVQRPILEKFINSFVDKCKTLRVGSPFQAKTEVDKIVSKLTPQAYYGPQISEEAVAKVQYYNDLTVNDSHCKILLQGVRPDKDTGNHITPHVYTCEWADKKYLKEEVFGPHVAIIPFDTVDDAIRIYNDTEYGLAVGIVTDNFRTMRKCRDECCAGMVYLNSGTIGAESHAVFGGVKKSGNGWKSAAGTFRAVTDEVAVTVNYQENGVQWAQGMK